MSLDIHPTPIPDPLESADADGLSRRIIYFLVVDIVSDLLTWSSVCFTR